MIKNLRQSWTPPEKETPGFRTRLEPGKLKIKNPYINDSRDNYDQVKEERKRELEEVRRMEDGVEEEIFGEEGIMEVEEEVEIVEEGEEETARDRQTDRDRQREIERQRCFSFEDRFYCLPTNKLGP